MTLPPEYGGHGRTALERYVVTEELLAAGAPVAAHWVGDRQTGPSLLRYGTEEQKQFFLPRLVSGEVFFAIGMSEPGSGSDLASVRTRAERVDGGWAITGTKLWTSNAHRADWFFVLCRSAPLGEDRHAGLSQFIIDLKTPGISIRPVPILTGAHHFNEVVMERVFVPDTRVLGEIGQGWKQVTSELAYERSGPERFMSTFPLLQELLRVVGDTPDERTAIAIGELAAELWALRRMSLSVAAALQRGEAPDVAAALVKDLGTRFESEVFERVRLLIDCAPSLTARRRIDLLLAQAVLHSPGFTLRGGTNEILRGVVARALGLR
jgi:alkylation response protein AidB-like acyl-CoA dehydrogenase